MILGNTSAIIQVVTASAVTVDVTSHWVDKAAGVYTPNSLVTNITTATTTTITPAPPTGTQRHQELLTFRNKHASSSNLCTVQLYDGTNTGQICAYTLLAGEQLFVTPTQWWVLDANGAKKIGFPGLSIAIGKTLQVNNSLILAGTDGSTVTFGAGGTVVYAGSTVSLNINGTVGATTAATMRATTGVFTDGTDATNPAAASVTIAGGLAVAKKMYIGTNLFVQSGGFVTTNYIANSRNPIFSFGDASTYGLSYFQGSSGYGGVDSISFHPSGTATLVGSSFHVIATGAVATGTLAVTGAFGCNGATPQTAYASGGALAAYGAGANGFDTAAHASALYAMVVAIRAALVANGTMS